MPTLCPPRCALHGGGKLSSSPDSATHWQQVAETNNNHSILTRPLRMLHDPRTSNPLPSWQVAYPLALAERQPLEAARLISYRLDDEGVELW